MRKRAMRRELTIGKSDGVKVHYERKSVGVRVDHEKKSDGMRVHQEKER